MTLDRILWKFLQANTLKSHTYLLGCSGGPDSLALFYALLKQDIRFHAVHIDHGWRKESADEAAILRELAQSQGVDFHLVTYSKKDFKGNLEEAARNLRFRAFKELAESTGAKGVFLGHHADDLSETVLKRVFEGASLARLGGMREVSEREGIKVFRPFLNIKKEALINYLEKKTYFVDKTNFDKSNLRGRLRGEIIPFLNRSFGKNIQTSLASLSLQSFELREYIERKFAPILEKRAAIEDKSAVLDLRGMVDPFERKCLVNLFFEAFSIPRQKGHIDFLLQELEKDKKATRKVGHAQIVVENGVLRAGWD